MTLKKVKPQPCHCRSYSFPHREGGGACLGPQIAEIQKIIWKGSWVDLEATTVWEALTLVGEDIEQAIHHLVLEYDIPMKPTRTPVLDRRGGIRF